MILYNTTFVVDTQVIESFKTWVSSAFIPRALESGVFIDPLFTRIVSQFTQDETTESFAVQFKAQDMTCAQNWNNSIGLRLIEEIQNVHRDSVLAFSTFMEIIRQ